MESKLLFNLPEATLLNGCEENKVFGEPVKHNIQTNWKTVEEQELTRESILYILSGTVPVIRQKGFLSQEECSKMVDVLKSHKIGNYDTNHVWPRVGCVGIAQTDYVNDKDLYLSGVRAAYSLQDKWKHSLGIDILERVMETLRRTSGMEVRLAREREKEYFAGVIRAINTGIQIHADFAPYEGNGWEIGRIAAQMSWNILLNHVHGGNTFIYDRQWQAPQDDVTWRKDYPKYAYNPQIVDGHTLKVVEPAPGDLYWFNPRNFHEVRPCDISKNSIEQEAPTRYTVSSFVGFMPAEGGSPDTLLLWS